MAESQSIENLDTESAILSADPSLSLIEKTLDTFLATGGADAVYGSPVERGETLVIPSAEVISVLGFGVGGGDHNTEEQSDEGSGGGGGGYVFSRPVAVVIASPEGVRVEPVVDVTKIALAGLTAGAFMLGMILRLMSPKTALGDIKRGLWR